MSRAFAEAISWGLLVSLLITFSGCSPFYVARAAYEQSKILIAREKITDVIAGNKVSQEEKLKLAAVLKAREHAASLGLNPGDSFTRFARIERDDLAYVLLASRPDSFSLFQWWYPIVGSVPYKGFFELKDAKRSAQILSSMGYEVWTRPTQAISTLGWFNDPILSTALRNDEISVVNTVFHESVHSTVWIPGSVDFNESLANYIGAVATLNFYTSELAACPDAACSEELGKKAALAGETVKRELAVSALLDSLCAELNSLYQSSVSREDKLTRRVEIFERHIAPLRARNPKMKALKQINNAEIMQLKLYYTELEKFDQLFKREHESWSGFMGAISAIREEVESADEADPWAILRSRLQAAPPANPGAAP